MHAHMRIDMRRYSFFYEVVENAMHFVLCFVLTISTTRQRESLVEAHLYQLFMVDIVLYGSRQPVM